MGSAWLLDPIKFGGGEFIGSSGDKRQNTDQALNYGMEDNRWTCFQEIQNSTISGESDVYSLLGLRGASVNRLFADKNSGLTEASLRNAKLILWNPDETLCDD